MHFCRPLIGPEVTWLVPGISLFPPTIHPNIFFDPGHFFATSIMKKKDRSWNFPETFMAIVLSSKCINSQECTLTCVEAQQHLTHAEKETLSFATYNYIFGNIDQQAPITNIITIIPRGPPWHCGPNGWFKLLLPGAIIFNRPHVARAVLQTALLFTDSLGNHFLPIFNTSSIPNR